MMLTVSNRIAIPAREIELHATGAQGAGGQHVNKAASAIHLRFDIRASSLSENHKQTLLALADQRISRDGVVVIKAQRYRSQDKNRADALARLASLIRAATRQRSKRKATRPSRAARRKRMDKKTQHGHTKRLRKPVRGDDG